MVTYTWGYNQENSGYNLAKGTYNPSYRNLHVGVSPSFKLSEASRKWKKSHRRGCRHRVSMLVQGPALKSLLHLVFGGFLRQGVLNTEP